MNANQKSQCDSCAFKLTEDQSTLEADRRIEEKYKIFRNLNGAPKKPRIISVGGDDDKTETCFINSPLWPTKANNIYCPDRIDDCLSLETALNIRMASMGVDIAREANLVAKEANSIALATDKAVRREVRKDRIIAIAAIIIAIIAAHKETWSLIVWIGNIIKPP